MANLFTDKICNICGKDVMPDMQKGSPENGFFDMDTKTYCHMKCRTQHYINKAKNGMAGLYSEMPIIF